MERKKENEKQRKTGKTAVKTEKRRGFAFPVSKKHFSPLGEILRELREGVWEWVMNGEAGSAGKKTLLVLSAGAGIALLSAVVALASFPLKVYPAGFALLSALSLSGRHPADPRGDQRRETVERGILFSAFSGVLLSCLLLPENGFFYLMFYLILFLCRYLLTAGTFRESILARVTSSSAAATALGMVLALRDGLTVNRVFGAVSFGILTPLFCYLLCGLYVFTSAGAVGREAEKRKRVYLEAGVFALSYLFLFALREWEIGGYSVSFVISVVLTLAAAGSRGALYGAAMGVIGGMASSEAAVAPAMGIAGFFAGLFFEYSAVVAVMVSFVAACGYCMYSQGLRVFGMVTADYLCGILIYLPLRSLLPKEKREVTLYAKGDLIHREAVGNAKEKLRSMSEAFSSLSQVFYTVSESMKKPGLTETTRLVSDCCSEVCSRCAFSGICWGKEHTDHVDAAGRLAARLLAVGQVEKNDFGEPFRSGCKSLSELTSLVNRRWSEISGNYFKNNKTRLLAGEYSSVARLLKNSAGEMDRELEYDSASEAKAKRVLKSLGLSYRRVAVFGVREIKIDVYGILLERVSLASGQVVAAFEKEFGCLFDAPNFLMFEESVVMRLRRRRALSLECAKAGCTKKGEVMNGDSVAFFETPRDRFYTLLCDGMGSGREAAFTSRLASIFIEKLMVCASPKNVTLEMLNAFLMAKTDETFTTVDLLEVDLLSGEANFIKAGAAPSFILRGNRIHRIESRTPPAGVLSKMCAEQTSFSLRGGDCILMLSDGAISGGEESWLEEFLKADSQENASTLCERIFSCARDGADFRDDLSVSVIRVMNSK